MGSTTGTIFVTYNQYYVGGDDLDCSEWTYSGSNGLVTALTGPGRPTTPGTFALVMTGTEMGPVSITVEVLDQPPAQSDLSEWEQVVEVSLSIPGQSAGVMTVDQADEDDPLPDLPSGDVRLRVHARGVSAGRDLSPEAEEPVEAHLLQIWPATPAEERVLKQPMPEGAQ